MGFSGQEYWSGLPFPSPGDLPEPGIELSSLVSPALGGRFFTTRPPDFFFPPSQVICECLILAICLSEVAHELSKAS